MKPALLALALVACTAGLARADGIFPDCPDDPEPCNTGCASQGVVRGAVRPPVTT